MYNNTPTKIKTNTHKLQMHTQAPHNHCSLHCELELLFKITCFCSCLSNLYNPNVLLKTVKTILAIIINPVVELMPYEKFACRCKKQKKKRIKK